MNKQTKLNIVTFVLMVLAMALAIAVAVSTNFEQRYEVRNGRIYEFKEAPTNEDSR